MIAVLKRAKLRQCFLFLHKATQHLLQRFPIHLSKTNLLVMLLLIFGLLILYFYIKQNKIFYAINRPLGNVTQDHRVPEDGAILHHDREKGIKITF